MRVLVCGGRNYEKEEVVFLTLDSISPRPTVVITGGARGADAFAKNWCSSRAVTNRCFFAEWVVYGKSAGPIRNNDMLKEGRPELVVAFPGGKGTADMVERARRAGVRVVEVGYAAAHIGCAANKEKTA